MNISAAGCTPIKPQASFGNEDVKAKIKEFADLPYDELVTKTDALNEKVVSSDSIKSPVAAAASIVLAGVVAYASGKKIANVISTMTKGKAPEFIVSNLKKGANAVKGKAANVIENTAEQAGNTAKVKRVAAKAVAKTEALLRKGFKKLAPEGAANAEKTFSRLVGTASVATVVPGVLAKDKNGDGVSDILQRGQNAYTGAQKKTSSAIEKVGFVAELVDSLT